MAYPQRSAVWGLVLCTFAAFPPRALADDCAKQVTEQVQKRYDAVRDLRGRFEQTTERVALGGQPGDALTAKGEVVFAKPGKMRWSYEAPDPSLVVSDGETVWVYDPAAREVQKLSLAEGYLSAAGVQFLLGSGRLADAFTIAAEGCDRGVVTLHLTPKQDAAYESLDLRVDRKSGVVVETTVSDLFGNRTRVAFEGLRENTGVDAKQFRFEPPSGVQVIELPSVR
jgi:outer membrane lipoprotein carrier protein